MSFRAFTPFTYCLYAHSHSTAHAEATEAALAKGLPVPPSVQEIKRLPIVVLTSRASPTDLRGAARYDVSIQHTVIYVMHLSNIGIPNPV